MLRYAPTLWWFVFMNGWKWSKLKMKIYWYYYPLKSLKGMYIIIDVNKCAFGLTVDVRLLVFYCICGMIWLGAVMRLLSFLFLVGYDDKFLSLICFAHIIHLMHTICMCETSILYIFFPSLTLFIEHSLQHYIRLTNHPGIEHPKLGHIAFIP